MQILTFCDILKINFKKTYQIIKPINDSSTFTLTVFDTENGVHTTVLAKRVVSQPPKSFLERHGVIIMALLFSGSKQTKAKHFFKFNFVLYSLYW